MPQKKLEVMIPMTSSTYTKRLKHPDMFTLNEICLISNALNTTVDNLLKGRVSGLEDR